MTMANLKEKLVGKIATIASTGNMGTEKFEVTKVHEEDGVLIAHGIFTPAVDDAQRLMMNEVEFFNRYFQPVPTHNLVSRKLRAMIRYNFLQEPNIIAVIDSVQY